MTIVGSFRKQKVKEFIRLVNHEVLPSIRKHGAYMTPDKIKEVLLNPDTLFSFATALREAQEAIKEREHQVVAENV